MDVQYKAEATLQHKRKPFKVRYMAYPLKLNQAEQPWELNFFALLLWQICEWHAWILSSIFCPLFSLQRCPHKFIVVSIFENV